MSWFTPAWKGEKKDKALKSIKKIRTDEELMHVVLQAPVYDVKTEALNRVSDDAILLKIIQSPVSAFSSLGSASYNFRRIQKDAFDRMTDAASVTQAALSFEPFGDRYIEKIRDDALLYKLAEAKYVPKAFMKISDSHLQIELARKNRSYVDYVREKKGNDWVKLGLDGYFPEKQTVGYAKEIILNGDARGATILSRYMKSHKKLFPDSGTPELLDQLGKQYAGRELWVQIGLNGFFPTDQTEAYAGEIFDQGDVRGLQILAEAAGREPDSQAAAASVRKIIDIYKKARNGRDAGILKTIAALPERDYGRHTDGITTYCDYSDHEDRGVRVHFDLAELQQ